MKKKAVAAMPARGTIALPRRSTRPRTAVQQVKDRLDPLTMARVSGVLVEPKRKMG